MGNSNFNFESLGPTGSIGFIVLIVGILFTAMTFYVFYKVAIDDDSKGDKERKSSLKEEQEKKIARLYPTKM